MYTYMCIGRDVKGYRKYGFRDTCTSKKKINCCIRHAYKNDTAMTGSTCTSRYYILGIYE